MVKLNKRLITFVQHFHQTDESKQDVPDETATKADNGQHDKADVIHMGCQVLVTRKYLDTNFMPYMDKKTFFANEDKDGYVCLTEKAYNAMLSRKKKDELFQGKLQRATELNNKGIELEKSGNIDEAIKVYEDCIKIGYPARHAFDRLCIIYRRLKMYDDELRIINLAILITKDSKYNERLSKLLILRNK